MKRREFLRYGLYAGGSLAVANPAWAAAPPKRRHAHDVCALGNSGVKLTRLAMGTGTRGSNKSSNQTRQLGLDGLADLYWFGYDEGVGFWDSADSYGSHPHLKKALTRVEREKVVIMTKTRASTAEEMKADLDRFRQELGTDYIDIILLHAVTNPAWPEMKRGAMDVLSEAREKGMLRAHGASCHSLAALRVAAKHPWIQVDLARLNPAGLKMDADPDTVISVLKEMKAAGKGVIGMKILGEGGLRDRVDHALEFAMAQDCLDCFTIGAETRLELADLIKRIPPASVRG